MTARIVQQLINLDVLEKRFDDISERLKNGPKTAGLQQLDFELRLQQRDLPGARKIVGAMEKDPETPPQVINFMRACLDFNEFKWLEASKKLTESRAALPAFGTRIDLMLGKCYEHMGEHDREVEVYQRAVGESGSVIAHAALAQALMRIGQNDRALAELQHVRKAQGDDEFIQSSPARTALLTLLLQRNARLPESDRDWKDIDHLVAATAKAFPDSPELLLVESNVLEQKGKPEQARKLLETAAEKDPKDPKAWLSLARLEFLKDGAAAALAMLEKGREKGEDSFALRQSQIVYSLQLPADQAKVALQKAEEGLNNFNEDEQNRLQRLVGVAYFRLDDMKQVREIWGRIAEKSPNEPDAQFTLFDIAMRDDDQAAIKKSIASIKRLFGEGSPEAKYVEARKLVSDVRAKRSGDASATLAKARELVQRCAGTTSEMVRAGAVRRRDRHSRRAYRRGDHAFATSSRLG